MNFTTTSSGRSSLWGLALSLLATSLAGCAGNTLPTLEAPSLGAGLTTGALANLATAAIPELPQVDPDPIGPPTELYARIARGAQTCWFGGNGPLKRQYIFHADAEPPSKGGQAEIVIHEIDKSTPNPRGARAFRVTVTPTGDTSTVQSENARFPLEIGQRMTADVRRWARNDLSCVAKGQTNGWTPQDQIAPITPTPTAPAKKKPVAQRET
jgi:hypothetical protein